ncbi:MAG: fimbrillin family protein [Muribaculaceae bacterium]
MNKLIYIILGMLLAACSDELNVPTPGGEARDGMVLQFEAVVIDQPQASRTHTEDVADNYITRDFKVRDSFGMFIIDADRNFVTEIDGHNALNIRVTTPDGKAWNLNSDIKEVVHKLGYKYVAYYPYSEDFNSCATIADIKAKLTAPAADQSAQAAIDWMYTEPTAPSINAVTTLRFMHRYAKIDIYNSYTQDHTGRWESAYQYTKTIDDNGVEHYRYILDAATPQTFTVNGRYSIGNELTGIKKLSYDFGDISIVNGRHAIVYTYRMDERCAIDLGLPSGVLWSPINLGAETASYMTRAEIAAATNTIGRRLAWGELFDKDVYSYDTYINDPYQSGTSILPADISETVYDAARQYWGGHWTLPTATDIQEFIDNTEIVSTETIYSTELAQNVNKITFRSKINGNTITIVSNGYINNASITQPLYLHYMSASRSGTNYCSTLHNNPTMRIYTNNRYMGLGVRPVLKMSHIYKPAEKLDIVVRHINDLAVDLGIIKIVGGVKYKLLWSPFNYGVDTKIDVTMLNHNTLNEDNFIATCYTKPGSRFAWGDTVERAATEKFSFKDYYNSYLYNKTEYNKNGTSTSSRDLLPEDDIVQLHWPSGWYIPTAEDYQLLLLNVNITSETIDGHTWFRLTSKTTGNYIMIPATAYIDSKVNVETWGSSAYLQSATMGPNSGTATENGESIPKRTCYALSISVNSSGGISSSVPGTVSRPTGIMIRPVKYVPAD